MPNIVQIRGTSGSGKSYIAYRIIDQLGPAPEKIQFGPRNKVGGYIWPTRSLAIIGRYETACGGCDAFSWKGAADDIEALINSLTLTGRSVLLEGLIVSTWGTARLQRLPSLHIIHLTTPLEDCLAAVNARRAERAMAKGLPVTSVDPKNTISKYEGLETSTRKQLREGIHVERHDRAGALIRAQELLGL